MEHQDTLTLIRRRQIACDIRDIRFLKLGHTGSKIGCIYSQTSAVENPGV